jgi:hypothetical protein
MAETPIVYMCLTSRICEQAGCWRNRVFCGHLKTFVNWASRLNKKNFDVPESHFKCTIRVLRRSYEPPCSVAAFELNSEPHTGARPSARLCVGLIN